MATPAISSQSGNALLWAGGIGVSAGDVVIQTNDMGRYDTHELMSTAGAMEVLVTLDGTNYTTATVSMIDMGAVVNTPVLVTVANRLYVLIGNYKAIRVKQNGATAVTAATMRSYSSARFT